MTVNSTQPNVAALFDQHAERNDKRLVSGHYTVQVWNRGRWREYPNISHASARRVECLKRRFGEQVSIFQWQFPDRIVSEPFDPVKVIKELGFGHYLEENNAA
jgi:hypothetical protein